MLFMLIKQVTLMEFSKPAMVEIPGHRQMTVRFLTAMLHMAGGLGESALIQWIRISPYVIGFDLYKTSNGGNSWSNVSSPEVHVDHHGLYIPSDES